MSYGHSTLKRVVVVALIITLIAPSYFAFPKKAEADTTSCVTGMLSGLLGGLGGLGGSMSVRVNDVRNASSHTMTAGSTKGTFIQDCIVKPLVEMMAKTLIRQFTKSMVNWINSGFEGSPSFVQDPGKFFMNVGDRALGGFIEGLGPIGEIICSPFDLRLRLSLGLRYSNTYKDDIGCRLSDIGRNFDNFVGGTFSGEGKGWNQWIQITDAPQNNPYGSYIAAANSIDLRIAGRHNIELMQLNWGQGFMGWSDCIKYEKVKTPTNKSPEDALGSTIYTDSSGQNFEETNGKCLERGPVKTPGSVIASQLNRTLQSEIVQAELANSIDAILGALVNQMINQVFSSTGLFGVSHADASGTSYADRMVTDYNQALATQSTTLPRSITLQAASLDPLISKPFIPFRAPDGSLTISSFCSLFKKIIYKISYVSDPNGVVQYFNDLPTSRIFINAPEFRNYQDNTVTPPELLKGVDTYNSVNTACQNAPYTGAVADATNKFTNDVNQQLGGGDQTGTNNTDTVQSRIIPLYEATANQSFTFVGSYQRYPAQNAIDGSEQTYSYTYGGLTEQWWEAKLTKKENIGSVELITFTNFTGYYFGLPGAFVKIFDDSIDATTPIFSHTITPGEASALEQGQRISIPVSNKTTGNNFVWGDRIRIDNPPPSSWYIALSDVRLLRPATTPTGPALPQATISVEGQGTNFASGSYSNTFNITPSQNVNGGKVLISLSKKDAVGNYPKNSFSTLFSVFTVKNSTDASANIIGSQSGTTDFSYPSNGMNFTANTPTSILLEGVFNSSLPSGSYRITVELKDSAGNSIGTRNYDFQTPTN